jgi:hypothetical protein
MDLAFCTPLKSLDVDVVSSDGIQIVQTSTGSKSDQFTFSSVWSSPAGRLVVCPRARTTKILTFGWEMSPRRDDALFFVSHPSRHTVRREPPIRGSHPRFASDPEHSPEANWTLHKVLYIGTRDRGLSLKPDDDLGIEIRDVC